MTTYYTKFSVNGNGEFPFDMLRYDGCYPRGDDDAHRIHNTIRTESNTPPKGSEREPIVLVHIGVRKHWEPTAGRWSSFGWGVNPSSVITDKMSI